MKRDQKKAKKLLKEANRFSLQNRNGKASKRYEQTLALDPTNRTFIEAYANHAFDSEDFSRSAELWDRAIEIDPENYRAYKESGRSYFLLGDLENALQRFDSAFNLKSDEELFRIRADAHYHSGHYKEALDDWSRVDDIDHCSQRIRITALVKLKKYDQAMKEASDLLEFHKHFPDAQPDGFNYFSIALDFHEMKEHTKALETIDQFISLNPTSELGHQLKAKILKSIGKFVEALLENNKAIEACCDNEELCKLYYDRGMTLYAGLERYAEAFDDFEKALELGLDDKEVHCYCASTCINMGKFECGLKHVDIYIRSMPTSDRGYWLRGLIFRNMNKIDEARAEYVKAWSLTPKPKRKCFQCQLQCHSQKHLMTCGNCRGPSYCSKACQKSNWALHKKDCNQWQAFIEKTQNHVLEG